MGNIARTVPLLSESRHGDATDDVRDAIVRRDALELRVRVEHEAVAEHGRRHRLDVVRRHERAPLARCDDLRRLQERDGGARRGAELDRPVVPRVSHEIDHVRTFDSGARIALEIEWNNKDPFYDRDLENFKRLHADGAISAGIIVTRGRSLHENMRSLVRRFVDERQIQTLDDLRQWGYDPTSRQRAAINKRINRARNPLTFREAFTDKFVADKFGEATTHWRKLEDRVHRGVGNPCPLVLIGLPDSIVTFHEGKAALAEVVADEDAADGEDTAAE